jgi:murein DD-endopeptidase MepM/ murein hydrolase activator NlpD
MKTNKLILTTVCAFLLTIPAHAQFNTIGTFNSKHIKTNNPPKSNETLTDNVVLNNTEQTSRETNESREASNSTTGDSNMMSLVSLPLKNIRINSGFGMRKNPIHHKQMMHNGIDLHARHENVLSMLPGTVFKVGYDNRSGKYVTVKTANYTVSYCHLSEQYVKPNDFLLAGEPLGLTGNTGASTGEHLHLTTKKDGKPFDPAILIDYIRSMKSSSLNNLAF